MEFSICRREYQLTGLRRAAGNRRIAVLVAGALVAVLLGSFSTSTGVAQPNAVTFSGTVTAEDDASTESTATLAAGGSHTCAIRADQTINCWGSNETGQTDAPDGQFTAIAAGTFHSCAIGIDGTITCWGGNLDGLTDPQGLTDTPDGQFTAIAAGYLHSCAIKADQTINCWGGHNFEGETDAPDGQFTAIAAGGSHSCAIRLDQTINCWGESQVGQANAPAGKYTAVAAGGGRGHSCAIGIDGTITCWGIYSTGGQFVQIEAPAGQYTAITAGGSFSCAIGTNQTIACWGTYFNGEEFVQMEAPAGQYTAITAGGSHLCAIGTDNTINCWGNNNSGQADVDDEIGSEDDDTQPEEESPADRCFAVHKFGAQPVDVAKTADRQTVLAQLSWGFHESIGCFLTLDEAALGVLQAAPAPAGFPAADPAVSQQCFDVHKFGAQPVDVAKSADRQTVLAQVRWGFHQSIGCYLTLDTTATAALRAAHTS